MLQEQRLAVSLYDTTTSQGTRLSQYHFNALMYLCSNSVTEPLLKALALEHGFCIFDQMLAININPINEASITAVARLTVAKGDGDYAFELVKSMEKYVVVPRLHTYEPALLCFYENSEAVKVYEVDHMALIGVSLEEPELAALLRVRAKTGRVFELLSLARLILLL
ncbi:Proteinaceous RNase P 3 [Morella rubra]|uniref:Proteinaceous RNase P 3 n=1 Tax=Morella rubra TaxID=262757 RepID=A0A6A1WPS3_9ROSI|nr:Proteinaceous RNase P 3 [Morella rubra]